MLTLQKLVMLLVMTLTGLFGLSTTLAQSPAQAVEITAADGKTLYASYYAAAGDGKAVILLHQLYTTRDSWTPLIEPLLNAGFDVLAVDLRGYGQTRGKINWKAAQQDTLDWAAWLVSQPGVTGLLLVGSSMGSNLALVGCAGISECTAAVAISPSLNYFGVKTSDAMQAGFPALIVYAEQDRYPKADVPGMLELGAGHTDLIHFSGRTHGMDLFAEHADLAGSIVTWLAGR